MKLAVHTFAFVLITTVAAFGQNSDAALRRAIGDDVASRDSSGKLRTLSAADHLARADAYSSNRMFPQAREHWQKYFDNYPYDAGTPKALFGMARSYMWEKDYATAVVWFDKLTAKYLTTKDGREGLAFKGASLVRLGKNVEAAKVYEQYVSLFPDGERIESAHLNIIDAYREAGRFDDANMWVDKTVARFASKPASANALHARLRMEIHRENWQHAVDAADRLVERGNLSGSMTSLDEVRYLKAIALERSGKKADAAMAFSSVNNGSYFGWLVESKRSANDVTPMSLKSNGSDDYPIVFRGELLQSARKFDVDPRFLLAIMKQESSFRANAKSPAGARGLLQLVFDTAIKYRNTAGYNDLQPDDLYSPAANIAVGTAYIAELKRQFNGMYEAIAASYNGGEDNAERWLARSKPKEPGIFTSEVGFAESKAYVFKVMNNYRVYRQLYDENLANR